MLRLRHLLVCFERLRALARGCRIDYGTRRILGGPLLKRVTRITGVPARGEPLGLDGMDSGLLARGECMFVATVGAFVSTGLKMFVKYVASDRFCQVCR